MNNFLKKRRRIKLITAFIIVALILSILGFVLVYFTVDKVDITGNTRYTDEQIRDIVFDTPLKKNSLYLYLMYHGRSVTDIPFIEKMDINILSPEEVRIDVYEKAVAGYVKYLGQFMYFDRDGIIVESTAAPMKDVPYVTGLDFSECVKYEPLPVKDKEVFSDILSLTQLFDKYELNPDRIYFSDKGEITLYFDKARVMIGSMDNIDEKMMGLKGIAPKLAGMSGTLRLDDYTGDGSLITFEKD